MVENEVGDRLIRVVMTVDEEWPDRLLEYLALMRDRGGRRGREAEWLLMNGPGVDKRSVEA